MLKQEKTFIVNVLLICLALTAGLFIQSEYKVLPQEIKVVETEKVVVQPEVQVVETEKVVVVPEVQIIEVPKECSEPTKKGFFN
jgi:hypothetical protein